MNTLTSISVTNLNSHFHPQMSQFRVKMFNVKTNFYFMSSSIVQFFVWKIKYEISLITGSIVFILIDSEAIHFSDTDFHTKYKY